MSYGIEITEVGGVEVLNYTEISKPDIEDEEILVKNEAIGVNFFDTYQRSGLYKVDLPFVLGQEGAGIVDKVGRKVTQFKLGDRVVYIDKGSYSEYTAVKQNSAIKIPDNVDTKIAAASIYQGLTAFTMMRVSHQVKEGEIVLIHAAAGGVGQMLVQLCKKFGATVIGTTSTSDKAKLAVQAGADYVINYAVEDVPDRVLEITLGKGVNVVFDGIGKDTIEGSIKCCGFLASLVTYGNASGVIPPLDVFKLMPKAIRLMRTAVFTFFNTPTAFQEYAKEFMSLVSQGHVKVSIFKEYSLKDIASAHNDLEGRRTTGKLILIP